jgi:prolipoprotein diacylglyceryltransferase
MLSAYGLLHGAGALLGCVITLTVAARDGFDAARVRCFFAAVMVAGFVLARASQFLVTPDADALAAVTTMNGWTGFAFPLSFLIAWALAGACRFPSARIMDAIALGAAPAIAIARLGCMHVGCCGGRRFDAVIGDASPGALQLLVGERHPTQLYNVIAFLLLTCLLAGLRQVGARPGVCAGVFLAGFGALRVGLSGWRSDFDVVLWDLNIDQIVGGLAALVGIAVAVRWGSARGAACVPSTSPQKGGGPPLDRLPGASDA